MKKPIILVDMDQIVVDFTPIWLDKYFQKTGQNISINDIKDWDFRPLVKYPNVLNDILKEPDLFYNVQPMPNVIKYIDKFLEKELDFIFVTQAPRKSDWACRDKKKWVKKYFSFFDMKNIIFTHRKELVYGDILIDDNPEHLVNWKQNHKQGITATISYPYNSNIKVDWRFDNVETAWRDFYFKVCDTYNFKI